MSFRLARTIPAIPIVSDDGIGPITHLISDSELEICHAGMTETTVKVRFGDAFYIVFRKDLELAQTEQTAVAVS